MNHLRDIGAVSEHLHRMGWAAEKLDTERDLMSFATMGRNQAGRGTTASIAAEAATLLDDSDVLVQVWGVDAAVRDDEQWTGGVTILLHILEG